MEPWHNGKALFSLQGGLLAQGLFAVKPVAELQRNSSIASQTPHVAVAHHLASSFAPSHSLHSLGELVGTTPLHQTTCSTHSQPNYMAHSLPVALSRSVTEDNSTITLILEGLHSGAAEAHIEAR